KLERMMQQNPNIRVEISGHTDNIGTQAYNMFLSRKRAEAVKDFLTGKGIDGRRIKATGYGESRPLASNDDEREGRELNRRGEFLVIGQSPASICLKSSNCPPSVTREMMSVVPYKHESAGKKEQVARMFDTISARYDFLNHLLSLGIDRSWRRKAIRMLR